VPHPLNGVGYFSPFFVKLLQEKTTFPSSTVLSPLFPREGPGVSLLIKREKLG